MVCDASKSSKSQENDPFYHSVWQGLYTHKYIFVCVCVCTILIFIYSFIIHIGRVI